MPLNEILVGDVQYILDLLPDTDPSPDMIRAIAESLLARKHGHPSDLSEAVKVVTRVANAHNPPD